MKLLRVQASNGVAKIGRWLKTEGHLSVGKTRSVREMLLKDGILERYMKWIESYKPGAISIVYKEVPYKRINDCFNHSVSQLRNCRQVEESWNILLEKE